MEAEFSRPKRRVRTLVSSGWGSLNSIGLLHLPQAVDQLVEFFSGDVVVEIVVHLHGGGPGAGAYAFHFFEGNAAVGGDFFMAYADFSAGMFPEFHAAAQEATDVRADLDVIRAQWLLVQHGIVADDLVDLEGGDAGTLGDFFDQLRSNRTDLILRIE